MMVRRRFVVSSLLVCLCSSTHAVTVLISWSSSGVPLCAEFTIIISSLPRLILLISSWTLRYVCFMYCNIHKKIGRDHTCHSGYILVERQKDTQSYLWQYVRTLYGGLQDDACILCYAMLQITSEAIANLLTRISQLWYVSLLKQRLFLTYCALFPLVDSIWAMMIVWRWESRIIRTVLCCVVHDICAQWYAHMYD